MKQLAARANRYLNYYQAVVSYWAKGILAYRLDFFLRFLFTLVYFFISIGFLKVVFSKVNRILDWSWEEAFLFMSVYQLVWTVGYVLFFGGLRDFAWNLVKFGNLDFILLRPINPRFQVSFSKPDFNNLPSLVSALILFIYATKRLPFAPQFWNILLFFFNFVLAEVIYYFFAFIIASFSLFSGRTGYALEFFDRTIEFAQYPTDVFKGKFYFLFYSLIPLALFSFLPSRFLLGKAPLWLIIIPLSVLFFLYLFSRILFKMGLKHYSSVSS